MNARAIFLHCDRISDLVLTLKFDHFLKPKFDHTIIFFGPWDLKINLESLLLSHNIDTRNIEIIPDWKIWGNNLPVDIYQFGGWIGQQFVKLLSLDFLGQYDNILIQDCDTFNIKPYHWISDNGQIKIYGLPHTSHAADYYRYLNYFTGKPRQTHYCFISEFMPIKKIYWKLLKDRITSGKNCHWAEILHTVFLEDFCQSAEQIWFSEYELLGNWALLMDPNIEIVEQKRFLLLIENQWQTQIKNINSYNVVANYNSIELDQIEYWYQRINNYLVDQ